MSQSDLEFYKNALMGQKLAHNQKDYVQLAGADAKTSKKIQRIKVCGRHGILDMDDPFISMILDFLNGDRMAIFATSERTNEITKIALQLPKGPNVVDASASD